LPTACSPTRHTFALTRRGSLIGSGLRCGRARNLRGPPRTPCGPKSGHPLY